MPDAPHPITADTVIRRNEALLVAPVHDEIVMMDITSGHYFGLDPIGCDIWSHLESPRTLAELVSMLVDDYDADETRIAEDVRVLIKDMAEHGAVKLG